MITRTEIIAQIDDELARLERVRDFLAAALKGSGNGSKIVLPPKANAKAAVKKRKQPAIAAAPVTNKLQSRVTVAPAPPPVKEEPQIKRIPPRRRMERRHLQTEKPVKSAVALSGSVPAGPVAVSADEARKVQERALQAAPAPVVSELRPENPGERSLGSLIQAFERRAGLSGLETP